MVGRITRFTTGATVAVFLSLSPAIARTARQPRAQSNSQPRATATAAVPAVDIVHDPADVPPPIGDRPPMVVHEDLVVREIEGKLDDASGTTYSYWTFNGTVPGPMLRVRQGDTVEVTIRNESTSHMPHSIDLHAAVGASGGAMFTQTMPGQSNTFTFVAITPGLFVYHCGTPVVAQHIANGMYGLILVEPPGGLPHVDREYYVMQGELYTSGAIGTEGAQKFDLQKLLDEKPEYLVFNGAVGALTKEHPMQARTGESVRIFFGNAGPNLTSSPHVMGNVFTKVWQFGSVTAMPLTDIQTATVPPGDAAILELAMPVPGDFMLVDHAITRVVKGLVANVAVTGAPTAQLIHAGPANAPQSAATAAPTLPSGDMPMNMEHNH